MDPDGGELDSCLPQPENPCLIVEDSQPDSVALEDDPESSYRAVLARRLSNLQPSACSPVLELISSPPGSRGSQSQSESCRSNSQAGPGILALPNNSSECQEDCQEEESQVLTINPPNKLKDNVPMDSDSTTPCEQAEDANSQFGFLALSQSQDYVVDELNSQKGDERNKPRTVGGNSHFGFLPLSQSQDVVEVNSQKGDERDKTRAVSETDSKLEHTINTVTSQDLICKVVRSEVSSSSQSEQTLNVQVLLQSQCLKDSGEPEQRDRGMMSSQQDMFDADKSGAAVDSTVSEPEQQGYSTSTPAQTLRLLQETLIPESLSQSSVDYVAPTPDNFLHASLIVPNSPRGAESQHGADESMDSLQPKERAAPQEEVPMETEGTSKPQLPTSTAVSQSSCCFVLEKPLSIPSQPEFSHDVFVPTQSQEAPKPSANKTDSLSVESPCKESSSAFTLPLQLCEVNTDDDNSSQTSEEIMEDTQDTQIEELEERSVVDNTDSAFSHSDQRSECNGVRAESQSAPISKPSTQLSPFLNLPNLNVKACETAIKESSPPKVVSCSQSKIQSSDVIVNSFVLETPSEVTPCSLESQPVISHMSVMEVAKSGVNAAHCVQSQSLSQNCGSIGSPMSKAEMDEPADIEHPSSEEEEMAMEEMSQDEIDEPSDIEDSSEEEDVAMEEESALGVGASSNMGLVLSQNKLMSSGDKEEAYGDESIVTVAESKRDSHDHPKTPLQLSRANTPGSSTSKVSSTSTNGHELMVQEPEMHRSKRFSASSGEMSFHFTLPKDGEFIGPVVGATPPIISELKGTLRHSTPIETFNEKTVTDDVSADVVMAAKDDVLEESGDELAETGDTRLSLRMKLVTPVEEGSSERFSLQKPTLSEEDESVAKVTTVTKAETSPSVFSRVRQVHRQQEAEEEDSSLPRGNNTPVRGELFTSLRKRSRTASLGCDSLPNSQSEALQLEVSAVPQEAARQTEAEQSEERRGPELSVPNQKDASQHTLDNTVTAHSSNKQADAHKARSSIQMPCSPAGMGEPETSSFRRKDGPSHRRHVRTIQEVRTTITRIITDVYYEDGKEMDRKVTEESEDPVVDCQVLDNDMSPCRTISSSLTSGDLGDISSLSSKASSLQKSSGGGRSTTSGLSRPEFIMPPSRSAKSASPKRGGGQKQRGNRGQKGGSVVKKDRGTPESGALVSTTPRGRAKRGRPSFRGGGAGSLLLPSTQGQPLSSSEDEPYIPPPRVPVSPTDDEVLQHSNSPRSSPEEASSAGSSFVGLRVMAKWSSNGYFYSGRIVKDPGEGRFRLRFDDGYECEVAGKDILLCDPIPLETEVTALVEDEFFSIGVVKGYKSEGQDLFYNIEREGQEEWYNRTSVILSLEQGNRMREHHSLGPYEPSTPLAKASDISLDNLVEGKRRRRGPPVGSNTPDQSSSSSPRKAGPSTKRRLRVSDNESSPAKRSRKGARTAQRAGVCNTSGSGTDVAAQPGNLAETHGPMPQNTSLFMGFAFMLTASSEMDRLNNILISDEDDNVQTGPFNKAYTESQLLAGGGFVLPDFNEEQCKAAYQSLLIVDQHCRTRKYLLSLASGVPCVSHFWVRDCCKDNKLLNYRNYLLPAGLGPDGAIVEWHPRCSPFKDLHFFLVSEKPEELWAQLVTMGGASSFQHFHADKDGSDVPAGKYDVVVADHSCPPLIEKNVTSLQVPLVSPEWLVQSIICGECLGFQSKPQYHHNYSSLTSPSTSSS
ncbi:TP53-binding protein 1 isoform X1 [Syngnathus typhle]|uniref:TP53-binding protein 1 isoform X1 n=1 Tax=Syngnathus typhle TaxID=161592 RepID=UPI002A6B8C6D|nr:TP53-binding protein 1 isoform X1 [Syngnathus typhle]